MKVDPLCFGLMWQLGERAILCEWNGFLRLMSKGQFRRFVNGHPDLNIIEYLRKDLKQKKIPNNISELEVHYF